jgi:drug/metabolite transporter (DMT)-like permease
MKHAFIQLHIAVMLAGFSAVFGKLIGLNEGLLSWYRLFFSVVLLGLLLVFTGRLKTIKQADFIRLGAVGFLLGLAWVLFYGSIKYANISVGVVCCSLTGFFTAVLEPITGRKRLSVTNLLLGSLAVAGVALIFHFDARYRTGIVLGVSCALLMAFFAIANRSLAQRFSSGLITFYEMLGGCIGISLLLPVYLYYFPSASLLPTWTDTGYLLLLSLLCTIGLYFLMTRALQRVSAFAANLAFNLEPVYSIVLAMLFFGESRLLNQAFYAGLGCILLSVLLQMLNEMRKYRRQTAEQK